MSMKKMAATQKLYAQKRDGTGFARAVIEGGLPDTDIKYDALLANRRTVDDPEVAKDVKKVAKGQPLSPILLVRGDLAAGRALQIADGYHRVCASYHLSEDTEIPCRIADIPAAAR